MKKQTAVVLLFCFIFSFVMPLRAQPPDLKQEITKFDLSTMPQYAQAGWEAEYEKDKRIMENQQKERSLNDSSKPWNNSGASSSDSYSSGGYSGGSDMDAEGFFLVFAGIVGIAAVCFVGASFFTDDNIIFN